MSTVTSLGFMIHFADVFYKAFKHIAVEPETRSILSPIASFGYRADKDITFR